MTKGWIAVDFDGTLSTYEGNWGITGDPIMPMVNRVKAWLAKGQEVRIFTARVSFKNDDRNAEVRNAIEAWCEKHLGQKLAVTCVKDYACIEIWDDKAVRVVKNTGMTEKELIKYKQRRRV